MEAITAAFIGLFGLILGAIISSINSSVLKTKETKLRIIEKVFEKRIAAHEKILELLNRVKTVYFIGKADENSNMLGYPSCLETKDKFSSFTNDASFIIQYNCYWFNADLERELSFFRDYLSTLFMTISDVDDNELPKIGLIVKQDFIDIATAVDKIAFDFFRKDIYKIQIDKHDEWHKYARSVTDERFKKTLLFGKYNEIEKIKNGSKTI